MGRVAVLGSLNVDVVTLVERHPAPGETVLGESGGRFAGGKGGNQAAAAARAGASHVQMLSRVGDDEAGAAYLERLARLGIDASTVSRGTSSEHRSTSPGRRPLAWSTRTLSRSPLAPAMTMIEFSPCSSTVMSAVPVGAVALVETDDGSMPKDPRRST